ncbi:hypothetical protein PPL_02967 [Heterostelium album PN500]|uniref:Ankyrin repeat protein n=1 Tax=Heterostelium pallidum (strain ATCC 26659 / Pp 5 / PN500) TaxID=670386 RepID=D3B3J9_HETP5|nr:hypothetical protein PPL_02967 [Heterostelium album PN500]EFA83897.1 hypothetical protein PPL_02967 [Heterostelium album PN500]|eukprot:XP_020436014.1 hypothetical protein PPL_02967 [Heterostelium album PN500]
MSSSNQNSRKLFEKCKDNNTQEVLSLLDKKDDLRLDVNTKFEGGCTATFFAAYHGNVELLKRLMACGADINLTEENGVSPLAVACVQGKIAAVELLLSENHDPSQRVTGLIGACQYGYAQVVRRLLDTGIDVNIEVDDEGATPLYVAVETAREEVVALLLSRGADPARHRLFYYPIHVATQISNYPIMERLLKSGAKPDVRTRDGATSLLIAAQNGFIRAVDILQSYKASPNIQMVDGSSPLYVACSRHHANTALKLLDSPDIDVNLKLEDGTTVLHVLAQYGNTSLIKELLDRFSTKIEYDAKRKDGTTPLLIAARHGQFEICQLLIDKGADLNAQCDGDTPLSVATRYGRSDTIRVLTEATNKLKEKESKSTE